MCKAPDPPKPTEPEKPEFLHNEYLDAAMGQSATVAGLRSGRSSLRIPIGSGLAVQSAEAAPPAAGRPGTQPTSGLPAIGRGNTNRGNVNPRQRR